MSADFTPRHLDDIRALFPGLELVKPGVVPLDAWWPAGPMTDPATGMARLAVGGVARKP